MDRQPTIQGERLLLRPLHPDDWDGLFAVASDPAIWEVHPAHDRWQEPVFRGFFADALARGGALVVIDRESGRIVGSSQYHDYREQAGGSVEIGWTFLARSLWGGSFNREMKRLMLAHAFAAVERVHFIVGEDNVRSRGAMVKIGGVLDDWTDTREMAGGPVRHVRFTIDRVGFASGPLQPI